jgi:hypothetical protein
MRMGCDRGAIISVANVSDRPVNARPREFIFRGRVVSASKTKGLRNGDRCQIKCHYRGERGREAHTRRGDRFFSSSSPQLPPNLTPADLMGAVATVEGPSVIRLFRRLFNLRFAIKALPPPRSLTFQFSEIMGRLRMVDNSVSPPAAVWLLEARPACAGQRFENKLLEQPGIPGLRTKLCRIMLLLLL